MGRAQSLVANGCLFSGSLLSQSPALFRLGLGCILAVCFFLKKKKSVCVCVFYFYFIFSNLHSLEDGMLGSEALKGRAQGTAS